MNILKGKVLKIKEIIIKHTKKKYYENTWI